MPDWTAPSTLEANSVHHGYATAKADSLEVLSVVGSVVFAGGANGGNPTRGWYGKLDPGGFVLPHSDAGPWMERWHYPIQPAGYIWQEDGGIVESPLDPFQVFHHRPHAIWNPHHIARVHLIVEYNNEIDEPYHALEMFDPLPEMQALVEAAAY